MANRSSEIVESDVCVVGAGPAGLTIASELAGSGQQVAVLESGTDRSGRRTQRLNDGEVIGEPYLGLIATRHRQLGGTANIWNTMVQGQHGAKYVPLDCGDLAEWPIKWEELESYYHRAQRVCRLGPFDYGPDPEDSVVRPCFPLTGPGLASAVYQLGTADCFVHDLPQALRAAPGCRFIPGTTATGLTLDRSEGGVASVQAVTEGGRPLEVRSRRFVLACGAIENARLLLLAGLDLTGLSPWIGKGFMEHPRDYSMVLWPDDPALFDGAAFYGPQAPRGGTPTHGRIALTEAVRKEFRLPNASLSLFPRPRQGSLQGLVHRLVGRLHRLAGVAWAGGPFWASSRAATEQFDAFSVVMHLEQRPSPRNSVSLGGRRDRFGNALPLLRLSWTSEEQAELERLRGLVRDWLREAGIGRLVLTEGSRPDLSAHHHAGTTRMGLGPEEGVVDRNGRLFGLENLYLAGASVFPTAGFANPVLTIVALALRLSDHLASLRPAGVPVRPRQRDREEFH